MLQMRGAGDQKLQANVFEAYRARSKWLLVDVSAGNDRGRFSEKC